ncbi:MAG TPA: ribonuclease P protein component [Tepidisphaeraceae bacterium]|jgi:ribonuclease P protein component
MSASRYTFPRSRRIGGRGTFKPIRDEGIRESRGPLTLWARPNELGHSRLGISIGRHVGNAVKRNRIKRLLRESFRLLQHDFPHGYDLVIAVRPHETMIFAEYQKLLTAMLVRVHGKWEQRKP